MQQFFPWLRTRRRMSDSMCVQLRSMAEYLLIEECDLTCCSSCTDECACNYDETATVDNEVCDYESCDIFEGCLIPTACNYDPCATTSDGSCEFGSCIIMGCTVPVACNYNPDANANDGSCDFSSCQGCTNSCACNYGETNTIEDGSCEYSSCVEDPFFRCRRFYSRGCTNAFACNYDSCATDGSNDGFVRFRELHHLDASTGSLQLRP